MAIPYYHVLYLDLDVAGTEAGSIADEVLWSSYIHRVMRLEQNAKKKDEIEPAEVNLVDLFVKYLEGEPIEGATLDEREGQAGYVMLAEDRINVLSSFLRRSDADKDTWDEGCEPGILFDDIHSEWFVEMLQEIVKAAARLFQAVNAGAQRRKKLLVVIDNAPGYSGYEPLIEDWLTDLGPNRGKFLYVSSLDSQDIAACAKGLKEIHEIFASKWQASRDYKMLKEGKEPPKDKRGRIEEVFFQRLGETAPSDDECRGQRGGKRKDRAYDCTGCGLCFYRQRTSKKQKRLDGDHYRRRPESYLGVIVNRVPRLLVENRDWYTYGVNSVLEAIGIDAGKEWVTVDNVTDFLHERASGKVIARVFANLQNQQVPYDERIEVQFLRRHISEREERSENVREPAGGQTGLRRELTGLRGKVGSVIRWPTRKVPLEAYVEGIIRTVMRIDRHIQLCRKVCISAEGTWVDEFWDNRFSLTEALAAVYGVIWGKREGRESLQRWSRDEEIHWVSTRVEYLRLRELHIEFELLRRLGIGRAFVLQFLGIWVSMAAIAWPMGKESREARARAHRGLERIMEIIVYMSRLEKNKKRSLRKTITAQFMLELGNAVTKEVVHGIRREAGRRSFAPFMSARSLMESFRAFCLAQARALSRGADLRFLIDCFSALDNIGRPTEGEVAMVRGLAQQVIVNKTMEHREGAKYLADILQSVREEGGATVKKVDLSMLDEIKVMEAFKGPLQEIMVKRWRVFTSI